MNFFGGLSWAPGPIAWASYLAAAPSFSSTCLNVFLGSVDLREGVVMQIHGESHPRLVTGKLWMVLQGKRAFKFRYGLLGATGINICGLCQNCAAHRSTTLPDAPGFLVPATERDIS
eukprot:9308525-Pyramimonas_sp.AAC.1